MYEKLGSDRIAETVATLAERIKERFPAASLVGVANELGRLTSGSAAALSEISKPRPLLRFATGLAIVAGLCGLAWVVRR